MLIMHPRQQRAGGSFLRNADLENGGPVTVDIAGRKRWNCKQIGSDLPVVAGR